MYPAPPKFIEAIRNPPPKITYRLEVTVGDERFYIDLTGRNARLVYDPPHRPGDVS